MFSTLSLTCAAILATSRIASSVISSVTCSVPISALYCSTRLARVSDRMRDEVLLGQRLQLDADRQAALQLGQHVARLGEVERARADEQHVVGLHRAVLGGDGGAFDQRQQVALHAFAADRAAAHVAETAILSISSRNTMPLASALASATRATSSWSMRFSASSSTSLSHASGTLSLRRLRFWRPIALPIISDRLIIPTLPPPGMSNGIDGRVLDLDLDLDLVHRVLDDALAEALAGRLAGVLADQRLEQPVHRRLAGGLAHRLAAAVLLEPDRFLGEVAGDLLDVAADVADLGELGRLDLDERRVGELGQPPADLGLAAAGRADHQDVLGRDLVAQLGAEPLAPPAVAQRHGDRALGLGLADDMLVERRDDGFGGESVVHSVLSLSPPGRGPETGLACGRAEWSGDRAPRPALAPSGMRA